MFELIFFTICFLASIVGAICGIGGGVIIKPTLDAFRYLSVAQISFLSGCTVLAMSFYSVWKSQRQGNSAIQKDIGFPLALGAALGGISGKVLFIFLSKMSSNPERIGAIQAICLFLVTLGTLLYTLYKNKVTTKSVRHPLACVIIGLSLGIMSSFLGIGGGPINLVVLYFFFSMSTKAAVENSLYIILFSQIANLILSVLTRSIPAVSTHLVLVMVIGGILGGVVGRFFNKKLTERKVELLFISLMIVMLILNSFNIYQFWQV